MKEENEIRLQTRVKGLAQEIEKAQMAAQTRIEALAQERTRCLAQIEPSAEVLAAKRRIEQMLGSLIGRESIGFAPEKSAADLGGDLVKSKPAAEQRRENDQPTELFEEERSVLEKRNSGEDRKVLKEAEQDDDWLAEPVIEPAAELDSDTVARAETADDDWLSVLSDESKLAETESDDFW